MRTLSPLSTNWSWSRPGLSSGHVSDVLDEFERIVSSMSQPTHANTVGFKPSCDITEHKDHYLVSFDMPGVKKDDIKIEVQGESLVISGERHRDMRGSEGESTLRHERVYGRFERSFTLPTSINADKIEAHYEDGVLSVALPKAEVAKGRTIQVQSGQNSFFGKLLGAKKENTKDLRDVRPS